MFPPSLRTKTKRPRLLRDLRTGHPGRTFAWIRVAAAAGATWATCAAALSYKLRKLRMVFRVWQMSHFWRFWLIYGWYRVNIYIYIHGSYMFYIYIWLIIMFFFWSFKYLLKIVSPIAGRCSIGTFTNPWFLPWNLEENDGNMVVIQPSKGWGENHKYGNMVI